LNLCLGFKTPEHIKDDYGEYIIRYMMSKNDQERSVKIQSDVTKGHRFLDRSPRQRAHKKWHAVDFCADKSQGRNEKPKFVLHFDCVGRGKVVFREEEKIELIKSIQKDIGEDIRGLAFILWRIGPVASSNCSHNFTAVVAAVY